MCVSQKIRFSLYFLLPGHISRLFRIDQRTVWIKSKKRAENQWAWPRNSKRYNRILKSARKRESWTGWENSEGAEVALRKRSNRSLAKSCDPDIFSKQVGQRMWRKRSLKRVPRPKMDPFPQNSILHLRLFFSKGDICGKSENRNSKSVDQEYQDLLYIARNMFVAWNVLFLKTVSTQLVERQRKRGKTALWLFFCADFCPARERGTWCAQKCVTRTRLCIRRRHASGYMAYTLPP